MTDQTKHPPISTMALDLLRDDADVLCIVLAEQVNAATAAGETGEYLALIIRLRDLLLRELAAPASPSDQLHLELAPVEAVCLLMLLDDLMAQYPDVPVMESKFNFDRALNLSHEMVTTSNLALL